MSVPSVPKWIFLGIFLLKVVATKDPLLCETQKCVEESERLKEYIDEKVKPCENFYKFACGNFERNFDIPETETYVSTVSKLENEIKRQIKTILVDAPALPTEPKYATMARDLYHTCLKRDQGNKSVEILLNMIKQVGGWPLLEGEDWDKDKFDWMDAVLKFHDFGFRNVKLFDLSIVKNFEKPNEHIIKIDEVSLGVDTEFLIEGPESNEIEAYVFYLLELATHLGVDEQSVRQEMSHILYFEIELARILTRGKEKNMLPSPINLEILNYRHNYIDWKKYLKHMLENVTTLKPNAELIVNKIDFVRKLEEILKRTSKRTLANFLIYRAAREAAPFLTEAIRKLDFDYNKMYHGRIFPEPRWKECISYTEKHLDLAIGGLFVRKYITPEAKVNVRAISERIHIELSKRLKNVTWLDVQSRKVAVEKCDKLKKFIAYPKEVLDGRDIRDFYKGLNLNKETWLEQHFQLAKHEWEREISKLRSPVVKHDWRNRRGIACLKVGFNYLENAISVSAGIIQEPFFSEYTPRYLNFGAIGFKIGHEIVHGFDYKGQHYDEQGRFQEWWQKETVFKFMEKTKCIFNESSNFTITGTNLTVNGENTLRENIADHAGLLLAYNAFKGWLTETHVERVKLIGFEEYTAEQMFWISAATTLCNKYSAERLIPEIQHGEQSPAEYRVNVPFRNQKGFAEDFKCSDGDYMKPIDRCEVW